MSGNTPGARCLNKHLNREKTKTSGTCDNKVGVALVDVSVGVSVGVSMGVSVGLFVGVSIE